MEKKTHRQSPTKADVNTQKQGSMNWIMSFILGLVVGSVLVGIIVWLSMPSMMIVVHQSRYDTIEETCNRLKASIEANGWKTPAIRNMNEAMAKCTAPGSLDTSMHYAASARASSRRAWAGLRNPIFSINHS